MTIPGGCLGFLPSTVASPSAGGLLPSYSTYSVNGSPVLTCDSQGER